MKHSSSILLLTFFAVCSAQTPRVRVGASIYIEPSNGYETFLAAAILKQHVPLVIVTGKDKADYLIRSVTASTTSPQRSDSYVAAELARRSVNTSIAVVDSRSSQIVFAYSPRVDDLKRTAEESAKHLKEFIESKK